ncbi:UDP-galactose transporter [Acrasis kona]|uniref:UDP-galactose transporter n=1 Tax=Acrasis kona TaxID=1008807 RepID=A0AAW2YML5_9EUKA
MIICSIGSAIVLSFYSEQKQQVSKEIYWKRVIPLSVLFSANILLGNFSLSFVSVAFNQIVKSSVPAWSAFLSFIFLDERLSWRVYASVVLVVGGVAGSCATDVEFETFGFLLTMFSSVTTAVQTIMVGKLLSGKNKLNSLNLVFNMAPPSALMLIPFALYFETLPFTTPNTWLNWKYVGDAVSVIILVGSGLIAFALNWSTFIVVNNTSPLTLNVAGNLKVIITVGLSVLLFNSPVSFLNILGCLVAVVGVTLYNYFKVNDVKIESPTHNKEQV